MEAVVLQPLVEIMMRVFGLRQMIKAFKETLLQYKRECIIVNIHTVTEQKAKIEKLEKVIIDMYKRRE